LILTILKPNQLKYIEPEIIPTADGSSTLKVKELDETYHSIHGALRESRHVFMQEGLAYCQNVGLKNIKMFEMGFGTGLNVFLSLVEALKNPAMHLEIHSIEKYPVDPELVRKMDYTLLDSLSTYKNEFERIIKAPWNEKVELMNNFILQKIYGDFFEFEFQNGYFDLVFYDAFGARAQEMMWTVEAFRVCARLIKPGGVLVTYASKGSARRALQEVGFQVDKIPGPPVKREMMRAIYR